VLLSADDESFLHGVAHVGAGRVRGRVVAVVVDGRARTVTLGDDGPGCACPQGRAGGAACEHLAAVALEHLRAESGIEVNDLVAAWFGGTLPDVGRRQAAPAAPRPRPRAAPAPATPRTRPRAAPLRPVGRARSGAPLRQVAGT
jgi:hypothetical protein